STRRGAAAYSIQLKLRERQNQVANGAHAVISCILLGPENRHELLACLVQVLCQSGTAFLRYVALEEKPEQEIDDLAVGHFLIFAHQGGRVGAPAEAIVLGRSQSESEVLAIKERLAVEPGLAAVPAFYRRREEDMLPKALQGRG